MSPNSKQHFSLFFPESQLKDLYAHTICEDGALDDITTKCTVPPHYQGIGKIRAKSDLVLAGLDAATRFFSFFDPEISIEILHQDGEKLSPMKVAATIRGRVHSLLAVERSALNLLQHLCGIATLTAKFVEEVRETNAKILDTRKTIPGLRGLAKYAVHCGGGHNHRVGLNDAILIKDNHVAAAGGVGKAVLAARSTIGEEKFIEVEVGDLRQLEEAMDAGADRAMLDNMPLEQMALCVNKAAGRIELEASGNVSFSNVRSIAMTGVDFISIGALTHSAPAADLNMKIEPKS